MFPISSFAGGWDGEGLTPGTNPQIATGSYWLYSGNPTEDLLAYRFSIYDENGQKLGYSVDLYRKEGHFGDYSTYERATVDSDGNVAKKSHIDLYNEYFSTGNATTSPRATGNIDGLDIKDTTLPATPTEVEKWLTKRQTDIIKQYCGADGENPAEWIVVVEPMYEAYLNGKYVVMTVAEFACYQSTQYGWTSISTMISDSTVYKNHYQYLAGYLGGIYPRQLYATGKYSAFKTEPPTSAMLTTNSDGEDAILLNPTIDPNSAYRSKKYNTAANILRYQIGMAIYTDKVPAYTIKFDANGGVNPPNDQSVSEGSSLTLPSTTPVRKGHSFKGWTDNAEGTGTKYMPGDIYLPTGNVTLYAQWKKELLGYVNGQTGNDSNSGVTARDSVKTLRQAYENLKDCGGTIYIVDTVPISKAITLTSTYYEDSSGRIDIVEGKTVTIKRYSQPTTVTDGFDVSSNVNALINVGSGGALTLENIVIDGHKEKVGEGAVNVIAEGVASNAALINVEAGALNIKADAVLKNNNNPNNSGGGVCIQSAGTLNMSGGLIQNNNAKKGAGVCNEGALNLTKGTISSNVAYQKSGYMISGSGGGIYSSKSFSLPAGVVIKNNFAINGGGVYVDTDYDAATEDVTVFTLDGAEITGNSSGDGGGVYVSYSNMILKSGKVSGNNAGDSDYDGKSFGYGGGISVSGNSRTDRGIVTVLGGEISNNTVVSSYSAYGGGIYSHWAIVNIEGGTISNNSCSADEFSNGGGVYLNERSVLNMTGGTISKNSAEEGGGVALTYYYDSTANFSGNAVVTENTATLGGGVYNYGCGEEGGGIYVDGNAKISKNTAEWGGGIYCDYGHATITGGTVESNTASYGGGAFLYYESVLTLTSNSIYSNNAELGSGVYVCGADEYSDISTFKMSGAACVGDTDRDGVSDKDDVYLEKDCYILVPSEFSNVTTDSAITTSKKSLRAIVTPDPSELGRIIAKFGDESSTEGKKALYWNPNSPKTTEQYFTVKGEVLRSGDQGIAEVESMGIAGRDVFISRAYSVTYEANGGSNAPAAQTKYWNEPLTLRTQKPSHTVHNFDSWNTNASGTGTSYNPGASYTANEAVVLYAQWDKVVADGLGYKTIRVGDVVDPSQYLDEFSFPDGYEVDTFEVIYNGVPRDSDNKATTEGTGYTIVYNIIFDNGIVGEYRLVVTVVNGDIGPSGHIRFISYKHLDTLMENSKWLDDELKERLEKTLSIEEPTNENAQQVWVFKAEDVQKVKEWLKSTEAEGKTRAQQNDEFYSQFSSCKEK